MRPHRKLSSGSLREGRRKINSGQERKWEREREGLTGGGEEEEKCEDPRGAGGAMGHRESDVVTSLSRSHAYKQQSVHRVVAERQTKRPMFTSFTIRLLEDSCEENA